MRTEVNWRHENRLETYIQIGEMSLKKDLISKQSIEIGNIFHLEMFRISFLINSKSLNPAYVSNPNDFFKQHIVSPT